MIGRYRSRHEAKAVQWTGSELALIEHIGDDRKVHPDGTLVLYRGNMPYQVRVGEWIAFDFKTPIHYVTFMIYSDAEFRRMFEAA